MWWYKIYFFGHPCVYYILLFCKSTHKMKGSQYIMHKMRGGRFLIIFAVSAKIIRNANSANENDRLCKCSKRKNTFVLISIQERPRWRYDCFRIPLAANSVLKGLFQHRPLRVDVYNTYWAHIHNLSWGAGLEHDQGADRDKRYLFAPYILSESCKLTKEYSLLNSNNGSCSQ